MRLATLGGCILLNCGFCGAILFLYGIVNADIESWRFPLGIYVVPARMLFYRRHD